MPKFALEPVLNYRKFLEEILQKELAILKKILTEEKKKLWCYNKVKKKLLERLQQKRTENIAVPELLLYVGFIDRVSRDLEKQRKRLLEAEKKFDQKLKDLTEAMKKKKMLDKLKENWWLNYRQGLIKCELDYLNEVAINRFNRRVKAG